MGPADEVIPEPNVSVIDGTGKFLMPGLAEMHAHIPVAKEGDDKLVRETLFLYLANGITTIRGMLGAPYHLELKKQVAKGGVLSPRIYTSSPSLNGGTVQSEAEARQKVTQYQKDGYDFLKIHPGIKRSVFDQIVQTANEVDISFSGHVPTAVGIDHALASNYASIDHLDGYIEGLVPETAEVHPDSGGFFGYRFTDLADETKIGALARTTDRQDVWIVPTQSLMVRWLSPKSGAELMSAPEMQYMDPATLYSWRLSKDNLIKENQPYSEAQYERYIALREKILLALHEAGVNFLLGSDAPQVSHVPGFSIHHEMQALADAGLSPYAILESGTINPARFFKEQHKYGTVEQGKAADLILLHANPLVDIKNMQHQAGIMVRGKWLPQGIIEARLNRIRARYEE
jgi:hypothetical protein